MSLRRKKKTSPIPATARIDPETNEISYRLEDDDLYTASLADRRGDDGRGIWRWTPPENRIVAKTGSWGVMTTEALPVVSPFSEEITIGRVFFLQHQPGADNKGFNPDGTYSVVCRSPWGDVVLWPWEYCVLKTETITELWSAGHLVFNAMQAAAEASVSDRMFYCMSRGIPRADAMVMALGDVTKPVGWFEADENTIETMRSFANVGVFSRVNHERRARARARRNR